MVGVDDFLLDVFADLIGAALVAVTVYLLFRRREKRSEQRLVETVVGRFDRAFNSFIANMVYNLRSDVLEPLGFVSLLLDAPISSSLGDMERLQVQLSEKLKKRDIEGMLQLRKKQWEIILSDDFLLEIEEVVGQWSKKQWAKYYVFLEVLSKQIRDLMDVYQSRLPSDAVRSILDFELETEPFRFHIDTFPEFFCRIDELEIELKRELMASRKTYQFAACERLLSMCHEMTKLQDGLKKL